MTPKAGLLTDKVILVTGASRGIGQCIAETYAQHGAELILTAEPDKQGDLDKVAQTCKKHGSKEAHVLCCDLTDKQQIDTLAKNIFKQRSGGVHVLVNNAGTLGPLDFDKGEHMGQGPLDGDPDEWERMYQANVLANMRLVRLLCPAMKDAGEGWVININSSNGLKPSPATAAYCTSKWGMRGWSLTCHEAMKEHGIRVTTIYPPAVSTPMTWERPDMDPVTELEAQPEDIAEAALLPFKCSQNTLPVEIMIQTLKNYKK
ncbi:hypothetical protein WJX73_005670 [Symbiochloris irregularis]|uniref:Uncharacterized protein n=1 Tax=Symbiochloris irregularis TaxID=706552 RepID=A0AAW1P2J6_9CHLO